MFHGDFPLWLPSVVDMRAVHFLEIWNLKAQVNSVGSCREYEILHELAAEELRFYKANRSLPKVYQLPALQPKDKIIYNKYDNMKYIIQSYVCFLV